jgi:hypothetical protein
MAVLLGDFLQRGRAAGSTYSRPAFVNLANLSTAGVLDTKVQSFPQISDALFQQFGAYLGVLVHE